MKYIRDEFGKKLRDKGWILADGATGTNLFDMGLEPGAPPEFWNESHPKRIQELHTRFVEAGSELFLTNSFGSNGARLKLHRASSKSMELSRISAELAREVADRSANSPFVAGAMGPTGEIMAPIGSLTHKLAVEIFHEQAEGLKAGGADLLWVETISATEEFLAAAEACRLSEMPWCGTMSFDSSGRTMMGVKPSDLSDAIRSLENPPVAFGANCGAGAADCVWTLNAISNSKPKVPVISKGNAGIPKFVEGAICYDGSPALMADYAELARNAGATIIGGCCGTKPVHVVEMRLRLESAPANSPPTEEEIVEKLGSISRPASQQKRRRRVTRAKPGRL